MANDINTISGNTFSSEVQGINQDYHHVGFTEAQGYCLILCFTLIVLATLYLIFKLVQTCILKINILSKKQKEELKKEILEELKEQKDRQ